MNARYDIFVSLRGSDEADGSENNPVRTFAAAQRLARKLSAEGKDVTVAFRGGVYLAENRVLEGCDGGKNANNTVCYRNYEKEKVVFSGSVALKNWTAEGKGVFSADLPFDDANCTALEGQKAMIKARFPKKGYSAVSHQPVSLGEKGYLTPCESFGYPEGIDLSAVTDADGLEAFVFPGGPEGEWNWFSKIYPVTNIDLRRRVADIARAPGTDGEYYIGVNSRFCFQNARCFLTERGEYVIDRARKKIYCIPEDEKSLREGAVTVAGNVPVLSVRGTEDCPAANISVRGICLCGTGLTSAALELENTEGVRLEGLEIQSAGFGIRVKGRNERVAVENCTVERISDTGIIVEGAAERCVSRNHLIAGNTVKNVGTVVRHGCGIMLYNCRNCTVRRNTVLLSPRYCIGINGTLPDGWFDLTDEQKRTADYPSGNHIVEENDCSHANSDTQDTGVIELYRAGRGNVIRGNYIHDSSIYFSFGFGLYLDDYNVDATVCDNVFYRLKGEGEGQLLAAVSAKFLGHTFVNNFIVDCDCYYGILLWDYPDEKGEHLAQASVEKNIFYDSWNRNPKDIYGNFLRLNKFLQEEEAVKANIRDYLTKCDENVVFVSDRARREGAPAPCARLNRERDIPLETWRKTFGYDLRTSEEDPLFKAPERGDFSFAENSPARLLRIRPLDVKNAGSRPNGERTDA